MNQSVSKFILLGSLFVAQGMVFAGGISNLQGIVKAAEERIQKVDEARIVSPRHAGLMPYDLIRDDVVAGIWKEEFSDENKTTLNSVKRKVRRDSCCSWALIPVAAIVSVLACDSNHAVINGINRRICMNSVGYAKHLEKFKQD